MPPVLNLHAIVPRSRANGPGVRTAIWFQGCRLACPGCFNPETHRVQQRILMAVGELLSRLVAASCDVEGITISGGEPFEQPEGLAELLAGVRARTSLSTLVFSGHTLGEITAMPGGSAMLSSIDVLIAGRYVQAQRVARGLLGSTNKSVHLLTDRYRLDDVDRTPEAEVWIDPDGTVSVSGIGPPYGVSMPRAFIRR